MTDAAAAMRRFNEAMTIVVDRAARQLAPADDPAEWITWTEDRFGRQMVRVELHSGRVILGEGLGKLEAIADAEARSK